MPYYDRKFKLLEKENIRLKELLMEATLKISKLIKENKIKQKAINDLILGDKD